MMKQFIILAASLFLMATGTANAQTGMPYFYELMPRPADGYATEDLREIRDRVVAQVRASLREDPSGNTWIEGTPCLTPNRFLRTFQELHPEHAPADLQALPEFLGTLQLVRARELGIEGTEYHSARMMCTRAETVSSSDSIDLEGVARAIRLDEFLWVHPNSGEPIMLGDCTNVTVPPEPEPVPVPEVVARPPEVECAAIRVPDTEPQDVIHVAFSSENDRFRDSPCWGLQSDGGLWDLPSPCTDCVWRQYDQDLRRQYGLQVVSRHEWTTQQGGDQYIFVPLYVAQESITGICISRWFGDELRRSCAVRVHQLGDPNHPNDWLPIERGQISARDEYIVKHITLVSMPPAELWRWPRNPDRQCGRPR